MKSEVPTKVEAFKNELLIFFFFNLSFPFLLFHPFYCNPDIPFGPTSFLLKSEQIRSSSNYNFITKSMITSFFNEFYIDFIVTWKYQTQ